MSIRFLWAALAALTFTTGAAVAQSNTTMQQAPAGQSMTKQETPTGQTMTKNAAGTTRTGTQIPQIDRFEVSPNNKFTTGTRLKFSVTGTPKSKVFLTIPGSTDPMRMKEVRSGLYQATYKIKNTDRPFFKRDSSFRADLKIKENVTTATLTPGQEAVTPSQGVVK